ncbi:hypothetical protein R1sor_019617 [Riccia sorocarpa]|uniref:Uncharacterized protein n=1 Tax=Riccia sorocarpa TaxID=122646 RepID=A0ABD3ID07_9MARC
MDAKDGDGSNALVQLLSELGRVETGSSEYLRLREKLRIHLEGTSSIDLDLGRAGSRGGYPVIPNSALLALLEEVKEAEESRIQKLYFDLSGNAVRTGRVSKLQHLDVMGFFPEQEDAKDSEGRRSFFGSGMLSQVVHLSISRLYVNGGDIKALVEAIESNGACKLKHLALPGKWWGYESDGIARLFKLGYLSCLEHLDLSYCDISQQGMVAITEAIMEGPTTGLRLEHLDLSGNDLGDCRGLATLFRAGYLSNLKYFSISRCAIRNQGAKAIFKAIMEGSACPIQYMDISTNGIDSERLLEFLGVLKSGHLPELQHLVCEWDWEARAVHAALSGAKYTHEERLLALLAFAKFLEDGLDVGGLKSVGLYDVEAVSFEVAGAFVSAYANNEALTLQLGLHWPYYDRSYKDNVEKYRKRNIALTSARSNLRDEEQIPATTGKVFLCGFPMVGKTTLRRSLQKTGISRWFFRSTKTEPRTRGIEVSKIVQKGRGEQAQIVLSVWDLAGQQEYRVLQSAFCLAESKATMFVIVCNAVYSEPQSRKELLFWFKFIACSCERGVQRHVVVTLNCFKKGDSSMKPSWSTVIEEERNRFADLLNIHPEPFVLNARNPSSTIELKHHLLNLSDTLLQGQTIPRICKLIPNYFSWMRGNLDCPVLPLEDCLVQIHKMQRGKDRKSIMAALSFLHERGDIVFFREDLLRRVASESESDASISGLVVVDPNWFCRRVIGDLLLPASVLQPGQSSVQTLAAADGSFSLTTLHQYFKVLLRNHPQQLAGIITMLMSLGLCYQSGHDKVFIPALIPKEDMRMWEHYGVKDGSAGYWVMGRSTSLLEKETMVMPAALFHRLQVNLAHDPEFGVVSSSGMNASSYTVSKSSSSFKFRGMVVLIQYDVNEDDPEDDRIDILVKSLGQINEDPTNIRKQQLDLVEDIMSRVEPISAYCCPGVQFQRNVIIPWNACEPTLSMRQRVLIPVEVVKDQVQKSGLRQRSNWTIDDRVVAFDDLLSGADLEGVERIVRERYSRIEDGARFMEIELDDMDTQVQTEDPPPGLLDAQNSYMLCAVRSEGQMTRQEVRSLRNHMDKRFAELQHNINYIFDKQQQI